MRVVTSLPELDPVHPGGIVRQVGPVVAWQPPSRRADRAREPEHVRLRRDGGRLQAAVDVCAGLPARVVVTTGPHVDPAAVRAPDRGRGAPVRPPRRLMPQASVCWATAATAPAMTALAHDVPVVVLPMDPSPTTRRSGGASSGPGPAAPRGTAPADAIRMPSRAAGRRPAPGRRGAAGWPRAGVAGRAGAADALEAALPERHQWGEGKGIGSSGSVPSCKAFTH